MWQGKKIYLSFEGKNGERDSEEFYSCVNMKFKCNVLRAFKFLTVRDEAN